VEPLQIGVYAVGAGRTGIFLGFALCAASVLLTLLLLSGLFSVTFRNGCFTWSSDGVLRLKSI
jgi:hypothetical protein